MIFAVTGQRTLHLFCQTLSVLGRIRTFDFYRRRVALYPLSYKHWYTTWDSNPDLTGFEPDASAVGLVVRSSCPGIRTLTVRGLNALSLPVGVDSHVVWKERLELSRPMRATRLST